MSNRDDDPFEPQDTRPALGRADRRESLRTDVDARVLVDGEAIHTEGNVSLGGFFIPDGFPASDLEIGTDVTCEVILPDAARQPDEPEVLPLPARVAVAPGRRPGCFLAFRGLSFEEERQIARLLDITSR